MTRPFDNTDGPVTSPAMLAHLIDHTTATAAPRRKRRQSSATSIAWVGAILVLLYFLGRML